ncbi:MAG: hypothetical protein PHV06_10970, partial [bacterium]|nr:hypothetical protein [bacterium]
MKNNSYVIFMICFFLMFFKLISASQEISLADIYKLTFEKDSFQSISKSTIDIEKNKIMQTVGLYKPQLKLEHLTSKRGGDYEFEPVVRYGNFEVPVDINIFRTYETKLVLNQLLYDHNRIKYTRKIGETEI